MVPSEGYEESPRTDFWDQYDNAQRVHETGFGIRFPTYEFEDEDLLGALDQALSNTELFDRMGAIAALVQASPGPERSADLIE